MPALRAFAAHEWARFTMYLYCVVLEYERTWLKFNAVALDEDTLPAWEQAFAWWLKHPGMRSWWKGDHPGFSPAFTTYLDTILARVNVEPHDAAIVAASFREQESQRFSVPSSADQATARSVQQPAQ